MFSLSDFQQLPQLKPLIAQLVNDDRPGVVIVTGVEAHPQVGLNDVPSFLPSGRVTFFDTLFQEILVTHPEKSAILITQETSLTKLPRSLKKYVKVSHVQNPAAISRQILEAMRQEPNFLAVDRLDADSLKAIFEAAQKGIRVITQLDTALWGFEVIRHLQNLGLTIYQLPALQWILTIRRLPALCEDCKRPVLPNPDLFARLGARFPNFLEFASQAVFYHATGCPKCRGKGRFGDILAFDIFSAHAPDRFGLMQASLLSIEEYLLNLAVQGYLPLEDIVYFEVDQRDTMYQLVSSSKHFLSEADASLKRKLAELEAANQVLVKRTEVLISLQETVQLLTSSATLEELATRVCQRARDMCGADRALLYYLPSQANETGKARVLAASGWDQSLVRQEVDTSFVLDPRIRSQPSTFNSMPPGSLPPGQEEQIAKLQVGLRLPLIAQEQRIGLMVIHSTQAKQFTPGERALLQTYANQAALAIQRAGLIEELRAKINQLEAAQKELVEKERLEHELELARQVQQSVLPKVFPDLPGFHFAAHNEPARQVGGDFYDVLILDDDHFGIIVADVSDKGMPAALYMALTRSLLLAESRRSLSPLDVLTRVNQLLLELGSFSQYVSVFYGVIERSTRQLRYSRAGHDRPLLLRQGEVDSLSGSGAVLGILTENQMHLSEEQVDLQPTDRLVLYTDGLIDNLSPLGEFYGLERLEALLRQHSMASPEEICSAVLSEMHKHRQQAEHFDDMTLLILEVVGP